MWQPASARTRNALQTPVPYYWVLGHSSVEDKWKILECNLLSWDGDIGYSFLSIVHNISVQPFSHFYEAGVGLVDGLHVITRRSISTGFNGVEGVVVNTYLNTFYELDMVGRVGRAGKWP